MQEKDLRKWHRNLAIIFVTFIIAQSVTGLLITLVELGAPHSLAHKEAIPAHINNKKAQAEEENVLDTLLASLHHGGGIIGTVYRIILGLGMLGVAGTGYLIYLKVRARAKPRGKKIRRVIKHEN